MRNRNAKRMAFALGTMLVMSTIGGCGKSEEEVMDLTVYVEASTPAKGDLVLSNDFMGTISPQEAVYVMPFVTGEVSKVNVKLGDHVKAGEVLCKIDDEAARLQLESAQASFDMAKASANQATGGSSQIQDIQMQSGITQLEGQINSVDNTINDSNQKLNDLKNKKNEASKLVEQMKGIYEKATVKYNVASSLLSTLENTGLLNGGNTLSSMATTILSNAGYGIGEEEAKKYLSNNQADADYAINTPILNAYLTMIQSGLSDSDLTYTGVNSLSNAMSVSQSNFQNATSALSGIESGISSYENAISQANSSKKSLQDNLDSSKKTQAVTNDQVKKEANEILDAQLGASELGIKSAKMQLDMYTLTAPISGVVDTVQVTEKSIASTGNVAFVISNKESMTVTFSVSEDIRNILSIGQSIKVERNGKVFQAAITEIGQAVDQQTGLFLIKASVEATGDELLSGTSVKVSADTYQEMNQILIPYDAVYYDEGTAYVYTIEDGLAVKKEVVTGIFNDTTISITSGLTTSDMLITSWSPQLHEGAQVSVREVEE